MVARRFPLQVQICGDGTLVGDETSGRPKLFFVFGTVQSNDFWLLANSGSARNLISLEAFNKLLFKPSMKSKENIHVIGCSGEELQIQGWTIVPVLMSGVQLWHEFGVVPELPLEVLIGGDIFSAHQCTLQYLSNDRK